MYKIFNTDVISKNARFFRGLLAGSITSIVLAIIYGLISSKLAIEFSMAFIGIGYLIGSSIKKYGRGVKIEFSILGAVLTALCIIIADLIAFFGFESLFNFSFLSYVFPIYLKMMLSTNINSILSLLFRAIGIYAGYQYSRIV